MKLKINGEVSEFKEPIILSSLINQSNLNPDRIIVQVNDEIIIRDNFETFELVENSNVEILAIVGGG